MRKVSVFFLILFCISLMSCGSLGRKSEPIDLDQPPPPPAVGQIYQYCHKGPRPWGDGQTDVTGERIIAVTGKAEIKKKELWAFEEQFEKSEGIQIGFYDEEYRLHRQILRSNGSEITIIYSPPIEERFIELDVNSKKTIHSEQVMLAGQEGEQVGTIEMTIKVRREKDVRMITPAGAYLCRHLVSRVTLDATIQNEQTTFSATVNSYWCDYIGWFVKEEQAFEPLVHEGEIIRPPYRTESVLIDYQPKRTLRQNFEEEDSKSKKK